MKLHRLKLILLSAACCAIAAPVMAQSQPVVDAAGQTYGTAADPRPEWPGAQYRSAAAPGYDQVAYERARADWLMECRSNRRHGKRLGGAVIGGLLGGVIGNRIAGDGDRVVGTVIGAAAGAVAGGAIGSSADRRAARDYCEAYLDQNTTQSYGYVPVAAVPKAPCTEITTTEEWVPAGPMRARMIPARRRAPARPVRMAPDKRVRVY